MADPLTFGILGLGMGNNRAKIAKEYENARIGCVCSLDEEKASAVAEELECAWTTEYDEMLQRDDLDVIGVFTPSGEHAKHCVMALEAGYHAMTTKPFDIRVEACQEAIAAAQEAGKVLAVDFQRRYDPEIRRIKKAVEDGVLGKLLFADLQMKWMRTQGYYDGGDPAGWRSRRATEGGSIANQGVHMIDELYWLVGPVKTVEYGRTGTLAHDIETEDFCMASLTFQNGAWGVIHTTTAAFPKRGTSIGINGTEGAVYMGDEVGVQIKRRDGEEVPLEEIELDEDWPEHILDDMFRAVTEGETPACPAVEGMRSVEVFNGVYEAAATGEKVQLDQPEPIV